MSPTELLELEERAEELVPLDHIERLVTSIYSLDVSDWSDESLAKLEGVIDKLIQIAAMVPTHQRRQLTDRLLLAREGVEQGMAPDPDRRPTWEQMRAFVANHFD